MQGCAHRELLFASFLLLLLAVWPAYVISQILLVQMLLSCGKVARGDPRWPIDRSMSPKCEESAVDTWVDL